MNNLKRWFPIVLVSGLAILLVGVLAASPALAQGPGWMMGSTQGYTGTTPYGPYWMMGGGMMHGGMMGGPRGMMGNTGWNGNWMPGMRRGGWGMRTDSWQHRWNHWGMMGRLGYSSDSSTLRATVPSTTTTAISFKTEVQPIFDTRCVVCHGGTAGLVLNNYENILRGGMHGPVVIPGDPVNSRLIQYVSSGYMPAGGPPLTQSQIQTLVNWVAAGAPNN